MDTVHFAPDLIEYAFVGVFLSNTKFMGVKFKTNLLTFALIKFLLFAPLFNPKTPKKHVLFATALICAALGILDLVDNVNEVCVCVL